MKPIYISSGDHRILSRIVNELLLSGEKVPSSIHKLRDELNRAEILNASEISPKTVVLNALVKLRDLETDELEEWILTLPNDANSDQKRISVLAPVGTAILGFSVGDEIEWEMPNGTRTLKIEHVQHKAFSVDDISRLLYG